MILKCLLGWKKTTSAYFISLHVWKKTLAYFASFTTLIPDKHFCT